MKYYFYILLCCCFSLPVSAATIYVDLNATGANNGTSWANAYTNLSDANFNATSGDDIWIATGTYYPDRTGLSATTGSPIDRFNTFQVRDGVDLYGGFTGTETMLSERNILQNPSILSGDLGTLGTLTDNVYQVVTLSNVTVLKILDGITISDGYGLGHPTINQRSGGAINGWLGTGGVEMYNCTIENNHGGVPSFTEGGAIRVGQGQFLMESCIIQNNVSGNRGAVALRGGATGIFRKNVFFNNTGGSQGGAVHGEGGANPIFQNCLFANNTCSSGGSAIDMSGASRVKAMNSTFYNNKSNGSGAAINRLDASNAFVTNCIFLDNGSNPITTRNTNPTFSCFFGDGVGLIAGTGNINSDPLLIDPTNLIGSDGIWGTDDDGLRPGICTSPVVDAGTTSSAPTEDFIFSSRPQAGGIDMGAYENIGNNNVEIDIQGNAISITDDDVTPDVADDTDFGTMGIGTPVVKTYTIFNTGSVALDVANIVLSGSNPNEFVVGDITFPASVAASSSTTFTITYSPSVVATHTASLTIYNSDCDEGFYDFAIQGQGTLPPATNALNFDGMDDYGRTSGNFAITGNSVWTFEFWAETTSLGSSLRYFYTHGNSGFTRANFLRINTNGELTYSSSSNFNTGYIVDNCWHHYAVVYDGTETRIYVDGNLIGTHATGNLNISAAPLNIGSYVNATQFFGGRMDEFRVWDDVRTQGEIQANMDVSLTGTEANLIVLYDFNQGTGGANNTGLTTLADKAGGDDDATLNNFALTGASSNWVNSPVPTTDKPEIDILGNAASIADGDVTPSTTDHTNFGSVLTCSKSQTYTYTIENTGSEDLTISTINSSLADFAVNNLSQSLPATIASGNSMTFDVTYTPSTVATHNATITIDNNDFGECRYTFVIEGNGVLTMGDIVRGDALDFDGINDHVNTGFGMDLSTTNFTFETWFKTELTATNQRLIHQLDGTGNGRVILDISTGGNLTTFVHGASLPSTSGIMINQWYHAALSYDGTTIRLYLNGILEAQVNATPTAATGDFRIAAAKGLTRFLDGQLDELRIWNTARTEQEIRENMHLTLSGCETGLVAYYQMNDGTGSSTLTDKSGNGNIGTLNSMDPATDWVASGVNIGNDVTPLSSSQTITTVPMGISTQNFAAANLQMRFFGHSGGEDYTVTYQAFTPNVTTGTDGVNIIQNPMWTVNKSTSTETQLVDYTFVFPAATFTTLDPAKYSLYWRTMDADGDWTKIATANAVTATTTTFGKISLTGQFMVVQESDILVRDVRGNMYDFNGVNGYITMGQSASLQLSTFTISCWFKKEGSGVFSGTGTGGITAYPLVTKGVGFADGGTNDINYFLGVTDGNVLGGDFEQSGSGLNHPITGTTTILDNVWYHAVLTYDGTTMQLYLNGNLDATTSPNVPVSAASILHAGIGTAMTDIGAPSGFFNGKIDEVRIWDHVRSRSELRENMHLTLKGNETGLVSYYQFNNDDPVGTVNGVKDVVGTNDGTTVNMATTTYLASEVPVAGGTSDRVTIAGGGVYNFPNTGVSIEFGATTPNGEIIVSRLETEKPHGWESISGDVDDEYFVVRNFGVTTFDPLNDITFNRLSYVSPLDVGVTQAASPLQLYKRDDNAFGATWGTSLGGAYNATAGSNAMISFNATNNVTSFSQIVLVNNGMNSGLPVELMAFTAKRATEDQVRLDWTTASELNNKGFYIERMLEIEGTFETVGFVEGLGTTTEVTNYQFIDENSYTGVSYYRLKQVDFDGTATYSEIRAVAGSGNEQQNTPYIDLSIYPNPVYKELNVRFNKLSKNAKSATIKIMAMDGQVVHAFQADIQSYKVLNIETVQNLTPAMYLLSIELSNGERIVQKFIKQ